MLADPPRLPEIGATGDGAAAVVLSRRECARERTTNPVETVAVSTVTPRYSSTVIEMPNFATDSASSVPVSEPPFRDRVAAAAREEADVGPEDASLAGVHGLSPALELDRYENVHLCRAGEAQRLLGTGPANVTIIERL